jgi:hypothetical protein
MISEEKMVHVASYLLAAAAIIILIKKSRDPREHGVIVTVFKDRNAMAFGGVLTIVALVTDFVHDGFLGMWNGLVGELVFGFILAAVIHFVSKWKNATKG